MSDGTVQHSDGQVTFRYERHLRHPVDAVWRMITVPDQIERWIGNRPEIDLRPGGHYITYHGTGDRVVDRILRLDPPHLLEHTFWAEVNPTAVVTWRLSPTDDGCLLGLTHVLSMADVRAAAGTVAAGDDLSTILSRNGAGWHRLLDLLQASLDGRTGPWSPQDQRALQERYAAMLG